MAEAPASKKRGRPSKYASHVEKASTDAQRKKARRRETVAVQREQTHNHFYHLNLPSMLPPTPYGDHNAISHDSRGEDTSMALPDLAPIQIELSNGDRSYQIESQELADHLPPPSPVLPSVTEDLPIENDDFPTIGDMFSAGGSDANVESDTTSGREPEVEVPNTTTNEDDPVHYLADQLTNQLISFQGCCEGCHREAEAQHQAACDEHISLATYLDSMTDECPEVLGVNRIASREDNLAAKTNPRSRREIFSGLGPEGQPPHICLRQNERVSEKAGIGFDIDSVIGFPDNLAVAKKGIRWYPNQSPVSDLQSGLHLRPMQVSFFDSGGVLHTTRRHVHQIPHYTFGRLIGFEDISLYFLFPYLYRQEQQCSRLRDQDFRLWMDGILLPAVYEHYSSAHVQHYPSSFDHGRYNATARGVETRGQRVDPMAREQQLMYYLPPELLSQVWTSILAAVQRPGFQQFRDVSILLQGKNLKVLTKDVTWERMLTRFRGYWTGAIDENHIPKELYFDIGKETCPLQSSYVAVGTNSPSQSQEWGNHSSGDNSTAETLLWKRCCFDSYLSRMEQQLEGNKSMKQVFYPFSMLHQSGSLTIETGPLSCWRDAGLLYTQFYPSLKEIFAAGNVYPFTNQAIETLALDKTLRRTWELVGGGLSHQPAALMKAYLYTKLRCHFALQGSIRKSFGVREEHRVSRELFNAIDGEIRSRQLHTQHLISSTSWHSPYYSLSTDTVCKWLRWNINKFCVGFEMVYSFQDPHFVTWEHTRIMLMFLRCLQFSYSGGLIQKVGGCWQDTRLQTDERQPGGVRRVEGLGFRHTMERYGYAWFLDKVDWKTLTFRQPHAAYMMFNNPSMQTAYSARYSQIRDVRIDFIRVDKARQWMIEFSAIPDCLELLEKYLRQLCLCAFRKDVFAHIKSILDPEKAGAALRGEVPLCYSSIEDMLVEDYRSLRLAHGHRLAVKSIDVLFSWLWEWKDGAFERKGWADKPYRLLFRQAFYAVKTARGKESARKWRQELKKSFLRSHWLLPYPQKQGFMRKDKDTKEFVWWPSFHHGLHRYYQQLKRHGPLTQPFPTSHIKHHPSNGWQLASGSFANEYMPYVVQPEQSLLRVSEQELYDRLVGLREKWSTGQPEERRIFKEEVLEYNLTSSSYHKPTSRWCQKKRGWVNESFEKSETPNHCSLFLREELENYEILQHHGRSKRRRLRNKQNMSVDYHSESESSSASHYTSDEESLQEQRHRQGKKVLMIAARMRNMIDSEREMSRKPQLYDDLGKRYNHRVQQVELYLKNDFFIAE